MARRATRQAMDGDMQDWTSKRGRRVHFDQRSSGKDIKIRMARRVRHGRKTRRDRKRTEQD